MIAFAIAVISVPLARGDSKSTTFTGLAAFTAKSYVDLGGADVNDVKAAGNLCGGLMDTLKVPRPGPGVTYYCLIHILRWGEEANASGSGKTQAVQAQRWIVYSNLSGLWHSKRDGWLDEDLRTRNRLFGTNRVYVFYVHINKNNNNDYEPLYKVTTTQKIPGNIQHLFALLHAYSGTVQGVTAERITELARGNPSPDSWVGGGSFDVFTTSDIKIEATARGKDEAGLSSAPETKLADPVTFDNEGLHYVDFSIAVPVTKISQVEISDVNGTATPVSADGTNAFAVVDFYLPPVDVKGKNWIFIPHPLAGIAFAKQPLHKILVAGAFGPQISELYLGAMFVKQPRINGKKCASLSGDQNQTVGTAFDFCPQFSIGINLPIGSIVEKLGKPK